MPQPLPVDPMTGKRKAPRLPWELHRALAEWNILQGHILPLLAGHAHDDPEVRFQHASPIDWHSFGLARSVIAFYKTMAQ